jgi:23S rRNA (guanosine2251-2'-O)-methyltransferase
MRKLTTREIFRLNRAQTVPAAMQANTAVLHNIRSLHNVGAAFRSADALGIGHLILSGYTPVPPRPEISKTALGADEFVPWSHYPTLHAVLEYLDENGHVLIGIEQTDESQPITAFKWPYDRKTAVFFGNEVTGLDDELLPHLHHALIIPQFGRKHSFNISVSFGIVFYDLMLKSLAGEPR